MSAASADSFRTASATTGRADLLRAYLELGDKGLAAMALRLGFKEKESVPEAGVPTGASPSGLQAQPPPVASTAPESWLPVPLWRQEQLSEVLSETDLKELASAPDRGGLREEDLLRTGAEPLEPAAIVAWPRLRRVLDEALRVRRPSRSVDVDRLVDLWSRGRVFHDMPRQSAIATSRIALVLDGSRRLKPIWGDQMRLADRLMRREGEDRIRFLSPPTASGPALPDAPVFSDEVVLALSDLGAFADQATRDAWCRFGRKCRAQGAGLSAMSPCPARSWSGRAERVWRAIDWERPGRKGAATGQREFASERASEAESPLERLLAAVSPAVRVEPGLLRAIRRVFVRQGEPMGLDLEVEIWRHPEVSGGAARAFAVELERAAYWQGRFAQLDFEIRRQIATTIIHWHRHLAPEIRYLEILQLLAAGVPAIDLGEDEIVRARDLFARASESLEKDDGMAAKVHPWAERLLCRASLQSSSLPGFRPHLARLSRALRDRTGKPPRAVGTTPEALARPGSTTPPRRVSVRQVGDRLQVCSEGDLSAPGGLLTELIVRDELLAATESAIAVPFPLAELSPMVSCPSPASPLILVSDVEVVRLEPFQAPAWSVANGRDEYGLWATFEVEGVEQRMRWIPPGRAWLGSPEDEAGRWADEQPRFETVEDGFWLADTPFTQEFWVAVMGDNPSEFKDEARPVESVSWEDCQVLLGKLAEESREIFPKFITEFEWEYACRAGTRTATWLGDLEIRGERNAPLLHEIAWYGGNSGVDFDLETGWDSSDWKEKQFPGKKAGTRRVATKDPNPWGLYDMLGNVFEWTSTEWASGDDEGARRVFRGGSWLSYARRVRAAFRGWARPGDRVGVLGFRLSLGQEPGAEPEGEGRRPVPEGVSERGTSRSAPGRGSGSGGELG